jgi:fructose 1,6-bisphosphatase
MVTSSVIKADIGGFVGHSSVHPDLEAAAREQLTAARQSGLQEGFRFEVHDVLEKKSIRLDTPDESYTLLAFIGAPAGYIVKTVTSRATGEIAAVSSTQHLS